MSQLNSSEWHPMKASKYFLDTSEWMSNFSTMGLHNPSEFALLVTLKRKKSPQIITTSLTTELAFKQLIYLFIYFVFYLENMEMKCAICNKGM